MAHVVPLVRRAAAEGADLIATPEGTNLLQRDRSKLFPALRSEAEDPVVQGLRELAAELGVHLLIGSALVKRDDPADPRAANRSLLVGPDGEVLARYDRVIVPEMNLGQLAMLLRAKYLVDVRSHTSVRGLPFKVADLAEVIDAALQEV